MYAIIIGQFVYNYSIIISQLSCFLLIYYCDLIVNVINLSVSDPLANLCFPCCLYFLLFLFSVDVCTRFSVKLCINTIYNC